MGADLVPLQRVSFRGSGPFRRTIQAVPPLPRSTMDPRYPHCIQHHLACDCREAEHAEEMGELRHYLRALEQAAQQELAGHPIFDYGEGLPADSDRLRFIRGDGPRACQCTGCRILRAADMHIATRWVEPSVGIVMSPDEIAAELAETRRLAAIRRLQRVRPDATTPTREEATT